jgi:hypothetical protein
MLKILALLILALHPTSALPLTTSEQAFRLEDSAKGNVILGADQALIERGEIYRTVVLLWGNLDVYGEIDEVFVLSGRATFHEGAKLNKSLVIMGGSFESKPGAGVKPEAVTAKEPGLLWNLLLTAGKAWRDNISWIVQYAAGVVGVFLIWLLGWVVFAGFPGLRTNTVDKLGAEWPQNMALGFISACLVPVFLVMLIISILGILFVPFYFLLLLVLALLSYMSAALWAGHRLLPPRPGHRLNPMGFLLGLFAFQILWMIPVGGSAIPVLLLWILAWGAILRSVRLLWK